jgi:hypothetical protein
MRGAVVDSPNLIRKQPGFEAGEPSDAWDAAEGKTRVTAERSGGFTGKGFMSADKPEGHPILKCVYKDAFKLETGKQVDMSAAVRFEGKAWAALCVQWLDRAPAAGREPLVVSEDFSIPANDVAAWNKIQARFIPARGASAFRCGVAFIGGSGRAFLDDVEVLNRNPYDPVAPYRLGDYSVGPASMAAAASVVWRGMPLFVNARLSIKGLKEGSVPAVFVQPPKIERRGDRALVISGQVISPIGGGLSELTRELTYDEGTLTAEDKYSGQSDELELSFDLPGAERIEIQGGPTGSRTVLKIGGYEFSLEYGDGARVEKQDAGSVKRLKQSFGADRERATATWYLREVSTTLDLIFRRDKALVETLRRAEKWGAVREVYRQMNRYLRDAEEVARNQKEIEAVNQLETAQWERVQREGALALLCGRPEFAEGALRTIEDFIVHFENPSHADPVLDMDKKLRVMSSAKADRSRVLGRLVSLGRACKANGKPSLARGVLELAAAAGVGTETLREAQELLKDLPQ